MRHKLLIYGRSHDKPRFTGGVGRGGRDLFERISEKKRGSRIVSPKETERVLENEVCERTNVRLYLY